MRALLVLAALALLTSSFQFVSTKSVSAQSLLDEHAFYRFYGLRRHNDIQGVEAVFDDYRRNWLQRYNSQILIGSGVNRGQSDTPYCTMRTAADRSRMTMANCGGAHIFRANVSGFTASDSLDGRTTEETGAIGYLGYEFLVSDDLFIGLGATLGQTSMQHRLGGSRMDVEGRETGAHLVGGYRFKNKSMLAWNISYIMATDDVTRTNNVMLNAIAPTPSTVTGSYDSNTIAVTGVWYKSYDLSERARVSLGIDYTLLHVGRSIFFDSNGVRNKVDDQWRGDFTTSLMFTRDFTDGELFFRIGNTFERLNPSHRHVDFTGDIGGSLKLTDTIALTASVGSTFRFDGFSEYRGSARALLKF
ncbi:MAG: hypothetical protein AAGM04_04385 [Pseudomonadota bacterium]